MPTTNHTIHPIALTRLFADIKDPRREHGKLYSLPDVILLAVCGVLCGCEDWEDVADFGVARLGWFQSHGALPMGAPSHDTLTRVFRFLDRRAFGDVLAMWVQSVCRSVSGVVAVDGKTLRGSAEGAAGRGVHVVSAWSSQVGLTLVHREVAEKSNEITAIPEILRLLSLKGCLVTIDAMGCQSEIAQTIRTGEADYLLAVKENQPKTVEGMRQFFADADQRGWQSIPHTHHQTQTNDHGRIEIRDCWACPDATTWIPERWKDLRQLVHIRRQRTINGVTSCEDHYAITSSGADAAILLDAARRHWGIENRCHWILDVAFNEDRARVRKENGPHNFATLRRLALNILRRETTKISIKRRRKRAGYDIKSMEQLLELAAQRITD